MTRIERVTSPLPRECSTTEPHGPRVVCSRVCSRHTPRSLHCSCVSPELPHPPNFLFASPGPDCGAGEGNRTLVVSLEGFCSTIELHPPDALLFQALPVAAAGNTVSLSAIANNFPARQGKSWWRRLDSNQRRRKPTDLQSAPFNHSGTPPRRTANYGCATKACQTGSVPGKAVLDVALVPPPQDRGPMAAAGSKLAGLERKLAHT
jgi:hypothetical protein